MPKYLIRDTSDESLSTIEGALPLDLGALLANGTYGVSALSNEVVVTVDANPVLTLPTATSTGETTATWGVTSNEAGGTIYAGVRPTASAALTAAQLIAGAGGAGVAWDSDTPPTADAANGGSFTGLTAGTAYKTDIVQVDASGNESTVVSSLEFTTDAAAAVDFAYVGGNFQSIASGNTLEDTVSVESGSDYLFVIFAQAASAGQTITPKLNGVNATDLSLAHSGQDEIFGYTITAGTTGSVIAGVEAGGGVAGRVGFGLWKIDGLTFKSSVESKTTDVSTVGEIDINTAAGDYLCGNIWTNTESANTWTASGSTDSVDEKINASSRSYANFSGSNVTGATPDTFGVDTGEVSVETIVGGVLLEAV